MRRLIGTVLLALVPSLSVLFGAQPVQELTLWTFAPQQEIKRGRSGRASSQLATSSRDASLVLPLDVDRRSNSPRLLGAGNAHLSLIELTPLPSDDRVGTRAGLVRVTRPTCTSWIEPS